VSDGASARVAERLALVGAWFAGISLIGSALLWSHEAQDVIGFFFFLWCLVMLALATVAELACTFAIVILATPRRIAGLALASLASGHAGYWTWIAWHTRYC
jgi:hypothetical protein